MEVTPRVKRVLANRASRRPVNYFVDSSFITLGRLVEVKGDAGKLRPEVTIAFISLPTLAECTTVPATIPICNGQCAYGIGSAGCYQELSAPIERQQPGAGGGVGDGYGPERTCQAGLDVDVFGRELCRWANEHWSTKWDEYQTALAAALEEYDADIVVVNELGIPITLDHPPMDFFTKLKDLANGKPAVIFAGSFHDARTQYNTGYIFTPDPDFGVIPFHKRMCAEGASERISVVATRQHTVVKAFGLTMGVLICLDLLHHSSVAHLMRVDPRVDLLLVPAHSKSLDLLEKTASAVSKVMPGAVGVVNHVDEMERYGCMYAFGTRLTPSKKADLCGGAVKLRTYKLVMHDFVTDKRHFSPGYSKYAWMLREPAIVRA